MQAHLESAPSLVLLDTVAAAAQLGCSKALLEKMRTEGGGPEFVKFGGLVRYRPSALEAWVQSRTVRSTTGARRKRA
ncbi:MAG TPA: helix-turn-helix domain-containing protein [Beijerinckiaceae bacterium]|jgi:predicted DNA-binding transcriptional regulator AlpA